MVCTSLDALLTKLTVVPAFTFSTLGKYWSSATLLPTPITTVLGAATFVLESAMPFAYPAVSWASVSALTWSGVFGTAEPAGLKTNVAFLPRGRGRQK